MDDILSDLDRHRALKYLPNEEGYRDMSKSLWRRFKPAPTRLSKLKRIQIRILKDNP